MNGRWRDDSTGDVVQIMTKLNDSCTIGEIYEVWREGDRVIGDQRMFATGNALREKFQPIDPVIT